MNTQELESRVSTQWVGYGTHEITIEYRGKKYTCRTHNTLATDRIRCNEEEKTNKVMGFYTYKGALMALWNECKRSNNLI